MALRPPSTLRFALAGALVGAALAASLVARARLAPDVLVLPGMRVGGEPVPAIVRLDALRAWVEERAIAREARRLELVDVEHPLTEGALADFGVRVDVDATVARVVACGRERDVLGRAQRAARAKRGEIDVPFVVKLDDRVARARLEGLSREIDVAPVSARLDVEHHGVIPETMGRYLDVEGAMAAVTRAAEADAAQASVVLPVVPFAPRFTAARVSGLDVSHVLASYDTYFSRVKDQALRGTNIDVAAAKLDGLVLMPGELFSFNDVVGERSPENGFQKSWEIHKGEMVEGVGGGTCQVASTLYAAAFFSGLDVLQRLPHSRPSAYVPMGLDATVVYPDVDLKLRNPYDFPLAIHAKVDGNRLHVEMLGASKPARSVEFTREIVETVPYDRELEEDDRLRGVTVRVRQHGIAGYTVKRTRVVSLAKGRVKREETVDTYPPTTEIDEVPPGFDEGLLPALPGAPGIEAAEGETATAPVAAGTGTATATATATGTKVVFLEAPGAHAPTKGQASPPRLLTLRR